MAKTKMLQGDALVARAADLGVSQAELHDVHGIKSEPELQRRVIEAERAQRESRLWIVALISAFASVFSSIAALAAVYCSR